MSIAIRTDPLSPSAIAASGYTGGGMKRGDGGLKEASSTFCVKAVLSLVSAIFLSAEAGSDAG